MDAKLSIYREGPTQQDSIGDPTPPSVLEKLSGQYVELYVDTKTPALVAYVKAVSSFVGTTRNENLFLHYIPKNDSRLFDEFYSILKGWDRNTDQGFKSQPVPETIKQFLNSNNHWWEIAESDSGTTQSIDVEWFQEYRNARPGNQIELEKHAKAIGASDYSLNFDVVSPESGIGIIEYLVTEGDIDAQVVLTYNGDLAISEIDSTYTITRKKTQLQTAKTRLVLSDIDHDIDKRSVDEVAKSFGERIEELAQSNSMYNVIRDYNNVVLFSLIVSGDNLGDALSDDWKQFLNTYRSIKDEEFDDLKDEIELTEAVTSKLESVEEAKLSAIVDNCVIYDQDNFNPQLSGETSATPETIIRSYHCLDELEDIIKDRERDKVESDVAQEFLRGWSEIDNETIRKRAEEKLIPEIQDVKDTVQAKLADLYRENAEDLVQTLEEQSGVGNVPLEDIKVLTQVCEEPNNPVGFETDKAAKESCSSDIAARIVELLADVWNNPILDDKAKNSVRIIIETELDNHSGELVDEHAQLIENTIAEFYDGNRGAPLETVVTGHEKLIKAIEGKSPTFHGYDWESSITKCNSQLKRARTNLDPEDITTVENRAREELRNQQKEYVEGRIRRWRGKLVDLLDEFEGQNEFADQVRGYNSLLAYLDDDGELDNKKKIVAFKKAWDRITTKINNHNSYFEIADTDLKSEIREEIQEKRSKAREELINRDLERLKSRLELFQWAVEDPRLLVKGYSLLNSVVQPEQDKDRQTIYRNSGELSKNIERFNELWETIRQRVDSGVIREEDLDTLRDYISHNINERQKTAQQNLIKNYREEIEQLIDNFQTATDNPSTLVEDYERIENIVRDDSENYSDSEVDESTEINKIKEIWDQIESDLADGYIEPSHRTTIQETVLNKIEEPREVARERIVEDYTERLFHSLDGLGEKYANDPDSLVRGYTALQRLVSGETSPGNLQADAPEADSLDRFCNIWEQEVEQDDLLSESDYEDLQNQVTEDLEQRISEAKGSLAEYYEWELLSPLEDLEAVSLNDPEKIVRELSLIDELVINRSTYNGDATTKSEYVETFRETWREFENNEYIKSGDRTDVREKISSKVEKTLDDNRNELATLYTNELIDRVKSFKQDAENEVLTFGKFVFLHVLEYPDKELHRGYLQDITNNNSLNQYIVGFEKRWGTVQDILPERKDKVATKVRMQIDIAGVGSIDAGACEQIIEWVLRDISEDNEDLDTSKEIRSYLTLLWIYDNPDLNLEGENYRQTPQTVAFQIAVRTTDDHKSRVSLGRVREELKSSRAQLLGSHEERLKGHLERFSDAFQDDAEKLVAGYDDMLVILNDSESKDLAADDHDGLHNFKHTWEAVIQYESANILDDEAVSTLKKDIEELIISKRKTQIPVVLRSLVNKFEENYQKDTAKLVRGYRTFLAILNQSSVDPNTKQYLYCDEIQRFYNFCRDEAGESQIPTQQNAELQNQLNKKLTEVSEKFENNSYSILFEEINSFLENEPERADKPKDLMRGLNVFEKYFEDPYIEPTYHSDETEAFGKKWLTATLVLSDEKQKDIKDRLQQEIDNCKKKVGNLEEDGNPNRTVSIFTKATRRLPELPVNVPESVQKLTNSSGAKSDRGPIPDFNPLVWVAIIVVVLVLLVTAIGVPGFGNADNGANTERVGPSPPSINLIQPGLNEEVNELVVTGSVQGYDEVLLHLESISGAIVVNETITVDEGEYQSQIDGVPIGTYQLSVVGQPQSDNESISASSQFTYLGEGGPPQIEFTKTEIDGQALVVGTNASERLGNVTLEVSSELNSNPVAQEQVAATEHPTETSIPLDFADNSRFQIQVSPAHLNGNQYTETMVINLAPSVSLDQPSDEKSIAEDTFAITGTTESSNGIIRINSVNGPVQRTELLQVQSDTGMFRNEIGQDLVVGTYTVSVVPEPVGVNTYPQGVSPPQIKRTIHYYPDSASFELTKSETRFSDSDTVTIDLTADVSPVFGNITTKVYDREGAPLAQTRTTVSDESIEVELKFEEPDESASYIIEFSPTYMEDRVIKRIIRTASSES